MTGPTTDTPFDDPVATALWAARAEARAIGAIGRLPLARGHAIALALYTRMRAQGARQIGWKIAATDPVAQRRFETDGPFTAPLFDASVIQGGSRLALGSLVAPVLEAEIGVGLAGGLATIFPCIEIADCRVRDWRVTLPEALADFGLQGAMVLGEPVDGVTTVPEVTISRDGAVICSRTPDIPAALDRAGALGDTAGSIFAPGTPQVVVTGAILAPLPLTAGRWTVSFGVLGSLSLEVVP